MTSGPDDAPFEARAKGFDRDDSPGAASPDFTTLRAVNRAYAEAAETKRDEIRLRTGEGPSLRLRERPIVLIASASRSGSTLLATLLSASPHVWTLRSEHVALYKLCGIDALESDLPSDRLVGTSETAAMQFRREVARAARRGGRRGEGREQIANGYPAAVAERLALQWPRLGISGADLLERARELAHRLDSRGRARTAAQYWRALLTDLREANCMVDAEFYDRAIGDTPGPTSPATPSSSALGAHVLGPPDPWCCLEEPPFYIVERPLGRDVDDGGPLILKASVDAYRLPLLATLFNEADLRVIHLIRNPCGSVNGLYAGWRSSGFFSYRLGQCLPLRIEGYSDIFPWGSEWWKFDVPPGWEEMVDAPLEYVCGEQWYQANAAIMRDTARLGVPVLQVNAEEVMGFAGDRLHLLRRLIRFLGIAWDDELTAAFARPPVVLATETPTPGRWKLREGLVEEVVRQPHVRSLAEDLGYRVCDMAAWP